MMKLWPLLVISAVLPSVCCALASNNNPVQGIISRLPGVARKNAKSNNKEASRKDGDAVLGQLNLVASTQPVLFKARPGQIPNLLSSSLPAIFRLGSGVFAQDYQLSLIPEDETQYTYFAFGLGESRRQVQETGVYRPPKKPLILYEFEACPFCRKVREACSMLSLPVTFRPTPKGGMKFRKEIKSQFGAKATFPYLMDPNTSVDMFESNEIIQYLFKVYGSGKIPWTLRDSAWVPLTAGLGVSLARLGAGGSYRSSNPPKVPVQLWAYEGSPFCKIVRETLCSLEIQHTVIFTPRGSPNRQKLWELTGRFQVPYLQDPNTGVSLFESEAIVEYLEKKYGVDVSPVQYI